jgi:predicted ATPase
VLPAELGAGISQIIPVIVAAVGGESRLALVEQPELHVHPALQVGLGDLFIGAVAESRGRRAFVVETHSEHLILRVLKRIRQTTENELPIEAKAFTKDQLSVVYMDVVEGQVHIRQLRVSDEGEFVDRWPRGFFPERMEELL